MLPLDMRTEGLHNRSVRNGEKKNRSDAGAQTPNKQLTANTANRKDDRICKSIPKEEL